MQPPVWNSYNMQDTYMYNNNRDTIQDFKSVLQQLTFNSKPIISELTDLAKNNISNAPIIVEIIENQLKIVSF